MNSARVIQFGAGRTELSVTFADPAAQAKVPIARADFIELAARVADAYRRGTPVPFQLTGDELVSLGSPLGEDMAARYYPPPKMPWPPFGPMPPGPPLFSFGTQGNGDVSVGTGSARMKVLRKNNERFVEIVAKMAWALKHQAPNLLTAEGGDGANGTDEILGICLPPGSNSKP